MAMKIDDMIKLVEASKRVVDSPGAAHGGAGFGALVRK